MSTGPEDPVLVPTPAQTVGRPKATFVREFFLFAPSVIAPALVGFVSIVVLTRLIDPAPFGRYALALAVATTISAIGGDWLIPVTIHFRPHYDGDQKGPFIRSVAGLGAGTAIAAGVVTAGLVLPTLGWTWAVAAGALAVAMMLSKTISGILRADLQTKRFSAAAAGAALVGLVAGLGTFLVTGTTSHLIWGTAAGTAFVMIAAGWSSISGHVLERTAERVPWKPLLRFGIPIAIAGIGGQALLLADRYVIAALRGDAEVGLYTPSYSLANRIIGLVFAPAFGALYPIMARLWAERNFSDGLMLIGTVHRAFALVAGFAVTIFIFFHEALAGVLIGESFREGSVVMAIVAPATFLWFVGILFHQVFEQSERTREITVMVGIAAATNLVLNVVLVERFGYIAAAWTTLVCYILYAVGAYLWSSRKVGMQSPVPWDSYARLLVFSAGVALWRYATEATPPLWLALAVTAPAFALILFVTREPLLRGWRQLLDLKRSGRPPGDPMGPL